MKNKELIHELKDAAYSAEDQIAGWWNPNGDYPEIDEAFINAKKALLKLFTETENVLMPNKDEEGLNSWLEKRQKKS